ncbi:hypothetical protein HanRHA438_Chr16g0778691 [Helianthus annuus]|nr:hypothetical protein HanRHA438_Chr16g0778691 [Helianthus annuus]
MSGIRLRKTYKGLTPPLYPKVLNQGKTGKCMACAFGQMLTILFKMKEPMENQDLILNHQPLAFAKKVNEVEPIMMNDGLQDMGFNKDG